MMDLEYFRNFITMVDSHTLTEAARRLNMVQPALSSQLKLIETYYKSDLIQTQRGGRRIGLTEAGQLLYNQAKYILAIADNLEREIKDCEAGASGTLRVSLMPAMVSSFMAEYMQPFCADNPGIDFEFYEGNADEQAKSIMAGLTEIGFVQTPLSKSYVFDILHSQRRGLTLVVHKNNPWISDMLQYIRLKDLEGVPLCTTRRLSPMVNRISQDAQIHLTEKAVCNTKAFAVSWAKYQMGASIVTGGGTANIDSDLALIPIREKGLNSTEVVYIMKDRPLSNVSRKFLEYFHLIDKLGETESKKKKEKGKDKDGKKQAEEI